MAARDAAWMSRTGDTEEAYTRECWRNNAKLMPDGRTIRILRPIQAGEEILVTYGWNFWAHRTVSPSIR